MSKRGKPKRSGSKKRVGLSVDEKWERAREQIRARPEPQPGSYSNAELLVVMDAQQRAGRLLGFKTMGYTGWRGQVVEGENLVEFALRQGAPLSMPCFKAAIVKAAETNDRDFFVRLGRMLLKKRIEKLSPADVNELELFIVKHWLVFDANKKPLLHDTKKSLCYYGEKAVVEICRRVFGKTDDQWKHSFVKQTYERLGLNLPKRRKPRQRHFQAPADAEKIFANWRDISKAPRLSR